MSYGNENLKTVHYQAKINSMFMFIETVSFVHQSSYTAHSDDFFRKKVKISV